MRTSHSVACCVKERDILDNHLHFSSMGYLLASLLVLTGPGPGHTRSGSQLFPRGGQLHCGRLFHMVGALPMGRQLQYAWLFPRGGGPSPGWAITQDCAITYNSRPASSDTPHMLLNSSGFSRNHPSTDRTIYTVRQCDRACKINLQKFVPKHLHH